MTSVRYWNIHTIEKGYWFYIRDPCPWNRQDIKYAHENVYCSHLGEPTQKFMLAKRCIDFKLTLASYSIGRVCWFHAGNFPAYQSDRIVMLLKKISCSCFISPLPSKCQQGTNTFILVNSVLASWERTGLLIISKEPTHLLLCQRSEHKRVVKQFLQP